MCPESHESIEHNLLRPFFVVSVVKSNTEQTVYTKDVRQENAEDGREAASTVSSEIQTKDENTEKDSSGTKNEKMGQNTVETTSAGTEEVSTQEHGKR